MRKTIHVLPNVPEGIELTVHKCIIHSLTNVIRNPILKTANVK